jgi:RNA polymerase sigma factor (sigma-70 family)
VEAVLEVLTPDQRDVVLLRMLADLSVERTAEIVGKRPGAVKQLQRRGLERLGKDLASQGVTQEAARAITGTT